LIADIWGQDIFQTAALRNVRFRYETEAKDVDFRVNTFTSKWEDMEYMLARCTLSAFNATTDDNITEDIRKSWDQTKQANHDFGATLRWSLQAKGTTGLQLVLQALPLPASKLRRDARLATDSALTIVVQTYHAKTTFEDQRPCVGPKPVLFARDPVLVKRILAEHPERLYPGR
jgi:hypothetical protein